MGEERYKRKIPGTDYKDTYHRFVVLYVTFISGRALLYIHLYTYMSVRSRLSNPWLYQLVRGPTIAGGPMGNGKSGSLFLRDSLFCSRISECLPNYVQFGSNLEHSRWEL